MSTYTAGARKFFLINDELLTFMTFINFIQNENHFEEGKMDRSNNSFYYISYFH